jgi:RNA polymerase sigma factor (sigma-70 family)
VVIDGRSQNRSQGVQVSIGQPMCVWIAWPEELRPVEVFRRSKRLRGLSRVRVNRETAEDGDPQAQYTARPGNVETMKGHQCYLFLRKCPKSREPSTAQRQYILKKDNEAGGPSGESMKTESTSVYGQLNQLFRTGTVGGLTDPQLLEQFVSCDEESAVLSFEAMVKRHGPMVLQVCCTILQYVHATEDAFQATFLVLARKARRLEESELLGNWLYGVAARTARKARSLAIRRRIRNLRAASWLAVAVEEPSHNQSQADLERILHEEIDHLPHPYRAAIIICYLEGLSQAEAAHQLRVSESTVRSRLARARKLLGQRLMHRGGVPSAGFAGLGNSSESVVWLTYAIAQATT